MKFQETKVVYRIAKLINSALIPEEPKAPGNQQTFLKVLATVNYRDFSYAKKKLNKYYGLVFFILYLMYWLSPQKGVETA